MEKPDQSKNRDINLLPELSQKDVRAEVYKRSASVTSVAALLFVALVLVGLFAYQLFLKTSTSRTESNAKDLQNQILNQKSKEITQRSLVDKLNEIDVLLKGAVPTSSVAASLTKLAKGSGAISLTQLTVKSDGSVAVSGTANGSASLSRFLKTLVSKDLESSFGKVVLDNLSAEKGSPYNFSVNMNFIPVGITEK